MNKAAVQDESTAEEILHNTLLSVKLKKKKKKKKDEQTVGIGEEEEGEGVGKMREVTMDEQLLLDRSEKEWLWIAFWDTPRWRLDKQRIALIEQLTDFNIQYNTIHKVLSEDKRNADELYKKYMEARTALKAKVLLLEGGGGGGSGTLDPLTISSLHKLKFLHDHLESVVQNLGFFDMILMDILEQEMKINQALTALRATEVMSAVNTEMKYARGIDLTYSQQMINKECRTYVKELKKRHSLDKLLANHQAATSVLKDQSQVSKVSTKTLLELLDDRPNGVIDRVEQLINPPLLLLPPPQGRQDPSGNL